MILNQEILDKFKKILGSLYDPAKEENYIRIYNLVVTSNERLFVHEAFENFDFSQANFSSALNYRVYNPWPMGISMLQKVSA